MLSWCWWDRRSLVVVIVAGVVVTKVACERQRAGFRCPNLREYVPDFTGMREGMYPVGGRGSLPFDSIVWGWRSRCCRRHIALGWRRVVVTIVMECESSVCIAGPSSVRAASHPFALRVDRLHC